jgi:ATP-dependent DNA helicase RecQ
MSAVFEALQQELTSQALGYSELRARLETLARDVPGLEAARGRAAVRLCHALQGLAERRAGTADVAVLLRQVIRAYARRLQVPRALWNLVGSRADETGLRVTIDASPDALEITADPWEPDWLPGATTIDRLEVRRQDVSVPGDGLLYAMTGHATYQTEAQKAAVAAALFAAAGSTTLVTLPTGAGKSMCTLLPAWHASQGGRIPGGTTLVIVPTVSLALDQEAQARRSFAGAVDIEHMPTSLIGSSGADARAAIWRGLRHGTLPLLYTSPEALMHSGLYEVCLESAEAGKLTRLAIDEVHLVETWGAGFRTEFQLLSAYRRRLLAASRGQLRTLLLSATVSSACEEVLGALFADADGLCRVRANRLRPEPSYWFSTSDGPDARERRVLDAIRHLPRPAILYVTQPDDATTWVAALRREGFERVAAFSGDTHEDERLRLIEDWAHDRRDIMVATSAFGVGVDKGDIRTVIHACLPETVDRFYQEVGRGGRDGLTSISLVCLAPGDAAVAKGMTISARITPPVAYDRWRGMLRTQRYVRARGDEVLLDVDSAPADRPDMPPGLRNREWNEHTLLLMQRAGILRIVDTRPDVLDQSLPASDAPNEGGRLHVQIVAPTVTGDQEAFASAIERTRMQEYDDVQRAVEGMRALALAYARDGAAPCLARRFAALYPGSALACGGCPTCRGQGRAPYADPIPLDISVRDDAGAPQLRDDVLTLLGERHAFIAHWSGPRDLSGLEGVEGLLAELLGTGFQQLIVPSQLLHDKALCRQLIEGLAHHRRIAHVLFPDTWVVGADDRPLFSLPTVVVYPPGDAAADRVFGAVERRRRGRAAAMPIIHIVPSNLYLASEHGLFRERVNGLSIAVEQLRERLAAGSAYDFF